MIQVAESHVQRVLDQMRADAERAEGDIMRGLAREMAVGAAHGFFLLGLIGSVEFSRRCDELRAHKESA